MAVLGAASRRYIEAKILLCCAALQASFPEGKNFAEAGGGVEYAAAWGAVLSFDPHEARPQS